jgi:hypothetical protein
MMISEVEKRPIVSAVRRKNFAKKALAAARTAFAWRNSTDN